MLRFLGFNPNIDDSKGEHYNGGLTKIESHNVDFIKKKMIFLDW